MNGLLKHLFTAVLCLLFTQLIAQPTFSITPATNAVNQGSTFTVDFRVSNFTNVASVQFPVTWNSSIITYQSISNINNSAVPGLSMNSFGLPGSGNAPNNQLVISWNHPDFAGVTLPNQTILFSITFQGTASGSTAIEFNENLPQVIEVLNPNGTSLGFAGNDAAVTVTGTGNPPPTGFTLTLPDVSTMQGSTVCLPMTVSNFSSILGMQFSVNYNATALTYTGAQNFTPLLGGFSTGSVGNPSPGNLTFTWNDPNASGVTLPNGTVLVELCFTVAGTGSTMVSFSGTPTPIEVINGNEMEVPFGSESSTITIGGGATPTGFTLTLADVTTPQGSTVCLPMTVSNFNNILGMQFSVNYNATALTYTGAQNFTPLLGGFSNGSVGNPSAGNLTFTWNDPNATGVTLPNGTVLVELCFMVNTSTNTTVTFSATPTPIEIINGNEMEVPFNSESGTITVGTVGPPALTLTLADVQSMQGAQVCLPLTVTNFTDIKSMQFSVNYNAAILTFTGPQSFNATLPGWGAAAITNPSAGNLVINWSNATGVTLPNGASLVQLCFNVVGNTTTDVTITGTPTPISVTNGSNAAVTTTTNSGTITLDPPIVGFGLLLPSVTAMTGAQVCLPLSVTGFDNILGMQFSINFDPAALTYTGAQNFSPLLSGFSNGSIGNPSAGNLTFTWNDPNATGVTLPNGTVIAELCFTVVTTTTTTISFSGTPTPIEIVDGNEMTVPFNSRNGRITVGGMGDPPGTFAGSLATVEACAGNNFCMNFTASAFTFIRSAQFSITYNAADLSFTQVNNLNASLPGLVAGSFNSPMPGVITFQWTNSGSGGVSLAPNQVLFSLCFNKITNNATTVTIGGTPTAIAITDSGNNAVAYAGGTGQVTCTSVLPLMIGQVDVVNLTCRNQSTGSITIVTMVNGSGNYTYRWSLPGNPTTASVTNLGPVTTTVTVTDTQTSQTATGTYNVTSPPALTGAITNITNILCAGESTGSITISASGGTPSAGNTYSYDWSGSLPDNVTTQNNLPAGTYSVTITDSNGCTQPLVNIQINALAGPIVLTGSVGLIPGGGMPGNINLSVAGGSPGFTYAWTGPNGYTFGGQDPNNIVLTGEYCVLVTDAFGCSSTTCFDQYDVLRLSSFFITKSCSDGSNGAIDISVAGGSCSNITYQWSNTSTGLMNFSQAQDVTGLAPGNYRVVVRDACANTSISADFVVDVFAPIVLTGTVTGVVTAADGTVDLMVSGGSAPFTYRWNNTLMTQDLNNLVSGNYCVTVTDAAGCTSESCFFVTPAALVFNQVVAGSVSCPGDTDGCVSIAVGGGAIPYTVTVAGVGNFPAVGGQVEICNLPAGDYNITVQDGQGSMLSNSFTIADPAPLAVEAILVNDTEDAGGSGSVFLTITGGTGIPTVTWDGNLGTGRVLNQLSGGIVTGVIRDENGCSLPVSYTIGTLTEQATIVNAGCQDSTDGAITATAGGGTAPYTFVWTMAGSPDTIAEVATVENLAPGIYFVVITDATGAPLVREYTISTQSNFNATAAVVSGVPCFDAANGQLMASVNNSGASTSFTYEWERNGQLVGMNSTLNNAAPGDYTVFIVDNFMCLDSANVSLTAPDPIALSAVISGIGCDDSSNGQILVTATGGTGSFSTYQWSVNNTQGPQLANLSAGTYTITVTDSNNCSVVENYVIEAAIPLIVTVTTEPQTDSENCDGVVNAVVLGGNAPYNYDWMNIPGNPSQATVPNLCFGTYFLVVTDDNGCTSAVVSGVVDNKQFDCFEERVVITPDGNGSNDEFIIFCLTDQYQDNHLEIYNRWGQLVFETDNYDNTWEGTSQNGDDLPEGPYYWVLDYTSNNGEMNQLRGSLTIVRDR